MRIFHLQDVETQADVLPGHEEQTDREPGVAQNLNVPDVQYKKKIK